jgi:hypothetical protein
MPKIDWRDDDQPRWERLSHLRRERRRVAGLSAHTDSVPLILSLTRDDRDAQPARRPLHLIWGEPSRPAPSP